MTPAALLGLFRSEMADTVAPYFWSNVDVYSYIDDAQKMFCRLTDGIPDAYQPALTRIPVVPGTEWYTLSPLILKIRAVTFALTGRAVEVFTPETATTYGVRFDGATGPTKAVVTGLRENAVRVWPVPDQTVDLELSVFRLPLTTINGTALEAFEIAEHHHLHLLTWAKARAYLKQDAECFDRARSAEFDQMFRGYCHEVLREQSRKRRTTGTTVYGGL